MKHLMSYLQAFLYTLMENLHTNHHTRLELSLGNHLMHDYKIQSTLNMTLSLIRCSRLAKVIQKYQLHRKNFCCLALESKVAMILLH